MQFVADLYDAHGVSFFFIRTIYDSYTPSRHIRKKLPGAPDQAPAEALRQNTLQEIRTVGEWSLLGLYESQMPVEDPQDAFQLMAALED
ncbi:hypothetical protein PPNSA23_04950 [Phyllobacterium phragmitis]|uniref:Uncharacterized protein n=1 Tax=Phyllobacterium phragmitis TaxID=2670329 RepID=A0ABQ0GV57_9HYPH